MTKELDKRAVGTDLELSEGVLPIGSLVHITTVTYAYRGKLIAVTPSFYVLENAVLVFETGPLAAYGMAKKTTNEETMGVRKLVERSACVSLDVW